MIYGVNIIITLLVTIWSSALLVNPASTTVSSLVIPESLPFEIIDGLMILQIPSEHSSQNFVFDTGAEEIIINQKVVQGSFEIVGVEQTLLADEISIDRLELGTASLNRIEAWAVDLGFLETQIGIRVDGIIGAQLLSQHSVLIDHETSTITFVPHGANLSGMVKHYNVVALDYDQDQDDLPIITIDLVEEELKLGFDTGANICAFDQKYKSKLSINSTVNTNSLMLDKLHLGQCEISDVPYLLKDLDELNKTRSSKIDGIISADALATQKIFIDSQRNKIFLMWDKKSS